MAETSGEAIFFDGHTARRRAVRVLLDDDALAVAEDETVVALWAYADLRRQDAPTGVLRLTSLAAPQTARLEIAASALAAEIERRSAALRGGAEAGRRSTATIIFWSLAAALSLVLTTIYLVPHLADRITPLVPVALERRLGDAVDGQVRAIFGDTVCTGEEGQAALDALWATLTRGTSLPVPATIAVLPSDVVNAVALPGGRVYLFDGLLERARSVDELAGVLAHELGHVARRDGLRALIQAGGSSFLLGLLFGDIVGGGSVVLVGRMLVDSAYSREAETAADLFAASRMSALDRPPQALGTFLSRLADDGEAPLSFLSSHPLTADRMTALSRQTIPVLGRPLLNEAQWQALKTICRP